MARKSKSAPSANKVIENTRPCAIFLPPIVERIDGKPVERFRQRMLRPGENDVPGDHWAACQGNRSVSNLVALKYLVDRGEGEAQPLPTGLDGHSEADAAARLAQISDVGLLTDLRDQTASSGLKDLAQKRIKELLEEAHDAGQGHPDPDLD